MRGREGKYTSRTTPTYKKSVTHTSAKKMNDLKGTSKERERLMGEGRKKEGRKREEGWEASTTTQALKNE